MYLQWQNVYSTGYGQSFELKDRGEVSIKVFC